MAKESTEVTLRDSVATVDKFFAELTDRELEDPLEIQARIMAQILQAPTLEEAFDVGKTTPMEDLFGIPLEVDTVKWNRSRYQEGFQYYAICFGHEMLTGRAIIASTSAGNVVAFLRRAELQGDLPVRFKVTRREPSAETGFAPHIVERV